MEKWLLKAPVTVTEVLEKLKREFCGFKVELLSRDSIFYRDFILDKDTNYSNPENCNVYALHYKIYANVCERKIQISTNVLCNDADDYPLCKLGDLLSDLISSKQYSRWSVCLYDREDSLLVSFPLEDNYPEKNDTGVYQCRDMNKWAYYYEILEENNVIKVIIDSSEEKERK